MNRFNDYNFPSPESGFYSDTSSITESPSFSVFQDNGSQLEFIPFGPGSESSLLLTDWIHPQQVIVNEPQETFRFRYETETTGRHGCLNGESGIDRSPITVKLEGCTERQAIIRCSLVTNNIEANPHVHRLRDNICDDNYDCDFKDVVVTSEDNWTAKFTGLTIIHTGKKKVISVLEKRLIAQQSTGRHDKTQIREEAKRIAESMDLHTVKLKFEAFCTRNSILTPIAAPVYSRPVNNNKCTDVCELKIVRMPQNASACCTGNEELFIFVEKVNKKNIGIRFFETNTNNEVVWEKKVEPCDIMVHHQYAIAFNVPPYKDQYIQEKVKVQFQLYRPSDAEPKSKSVPKPFFYTPKELGPKRVRLSTSNPDKYPEPDFSCALKKPDLQKVNSAIVMNAPLLPLAHPGVGSSDGVISNTQLRIENQLILPQQKMGGPTISNSSLSTQQSVDNSLSFSQQPGGYQNKSPYSFTSPVPDIAQQHQAYNLINATSLFNNQNQVELPKTSYFNQQEYSQQQQRQITQPPGTSSSCSTLSSQSVFEKQVEHLFSGMNASWMEEQWNSNREIFNNQTTFESSTSLSFEDLVADGLANSMKAMAISKA